MRLSRFQRFADHREAGAPHQDVIRPVTQVDVNLLDGRLATLPDLSDRPVGFDDCNPGLKAQHGALPIVETPLRQGSGSNVGRPSRGTRCHVPFELRQIGQEGQIAVSGSGERAPAAARRHR